MKRGATDFLCPVLVIDELDEDLSRAGIEPCEPPELRISCLLMSSLKLDEEGSVDFSFRVSSALIGRLYFFDQSFIQLEKTTSDAQCANGILNLKVGGLNLT
uniref:Uncharacterized protein n=1 Tax=Cacopsylla melanoneura TaxID=428564 RepID=A0A8D8V749_9HEMI